MKTSLRKLVLFIDWGIKKTCGILSLCVFFQQIFFLLATLPLSYPLVNVSPIFPLTFARLPRSDNHCEQTVISYSDAQNNELIFSFLSDLKYRTLSGAALACVAWGFKQFERLHKAGKPRKRVARPWGAWGRDKCAFNSSLIPWVLVPLHQRSDSECTQKVIFSYKFRHLNIKNAGKAFSTRTTFYLTNRFHVAVRLFSSRSQMTSKCGKNK